MNALLSRSVSWRRFLVLLAACIVADGIASAAGLRPRVAFASVARAAQFDPLAAGDNLRPTERAFLRQAIELIRHQRKLAQLGVAQATSADVRTFAQELATDMRSIGDSVESVARNKGVVVMPVDETNSETVTRLRDLAGENFDREFVRAAFTSIDGLMKVFDNATADAKDADVFDLAGSALPSLRSHANRVRELRKTFE